MNDWRASAWRWTLRIASVGAGIYVEYRQVQAGPRASSSLILLGLWFIAVPPAQWLDSLRRTTAAASKLRERPQPPDPKDQD